MLKDLKLQVRCLALCLAVTAFTGLPALAQAGLPGDGVITIYSNLATGDAVYDCCAALTTSATGSPLGTAVAIGNAFTPATDATITQVQVALGNATGTNAIIISIQSDENGRPGPVVQHWLQKKLPSLGKCCTLVTKDFFPGIPVTGGTQYWLVVHQTAKGNDTWGGWNLNLNNAVGPVAMKVGNDRMRNRGVQLQGAFAIFGQ